MKFTQKFISKTGKEILFRYPTMDDAKKLMNYINKLSAERTYILMQGSKKTLEDEKKWLQSFLEHQDKKVIISAFYKNKLIGVSDIELKDGAKNHVGSFGITVAKDFRGEGIGKKLMELVLNESIKHIKGLKIIELEVFGENKLACNMYQEFGFQEFGCLPQGLKRLNRYDDAILMYKKVK